ncbi:MAG: hypothetical protein HY955_03905 [Deltaproteobacteria bacterium]|nr:hypothetical protein [Deltaproteobacteria bacterium]
MRLKAFLFTAAVFFAGCAVVKPLPPEAPVTRASEAPVSIRAEAIVVMKRRMDLGGRAVILAEAPDKFRIEVTGPFNHLAALLVSDGRSFFSYIGDDTEVKDWDDPRLPYSFSSSEIVSFLLGAQADKEAADRGFEVSKDADRSVFKRHRKNGDLKVELSDFRSIGTLRIPYRIDIEDGKRRLTVKYSSVEVNPSIDPMSFDIDALLPHATPFPGG